MAKFNFEIPAAVQAELDARDEAEEKKQKEQLEVGVIKLKFPWGNEKRGVPSSILRSALFGVVRRGRREMLDNVEIASWSNTSIRFTGKKLQQSDQDVWMACVEACKREGKTDVVIGQRELSRLAGRKGGNTNRLLDDLDRLVFAGIKVEDSCYAYTGTLIHDAIRDKRTGKIALSINPKMMGLFGQNVTHLETEKRHALALDLSKWLQGYVLSHKATWRKPHFVGVDTVQELCGSSATIRKFRQQLRNAMNELQEQQIIAGWKLENDILKLWK